MSVGRRIGIVIGVGEYDEPSLDDLNAPEIDAQKISEVLLDSNIGGFDDCIRIVDRKKDDIVNIIVETTKSCGALDTIVFYYSGHGLIDDDFDFFLGATDTKAQSLDSSAVSFNQVLKLLDRCAANRQIIVIDACHAGAFHLNTPKSFGHRLSSIVELSNISDGVGRVVLCATDEFSTVSDTSNDSIEALSELSRVIFQGLNSGDADIDSDGFVSANDLVQYCDLNSIQARPYSWLYKSSGKILIARNRKFLGFDVRTLGAIDDDVLARLANSSSDSKISAIATLSNYAFRDDEKGRAAKVALNYYSKSIDKHVSYAAKQAKKNSLKIFAVPKAQDVVSKKQISAEVKIAHNISLNFVYVEAGMFLMGSDAEQQYSQINQQPIHVVNLDGYWISKYPITQKQFREFVTQSRYLPESEKSEGLRVAHNKTNRRYERTGRNWRNPFSKSSVYNVFSDHPVVFISFRDAVSFCQWASAKTGVKVALPSEAEWEKAARGDDARVWPWGNNHPTELLCNYRELSGSTTPVGLYSSVGDSPFCCADMAGNVWEWTTGTPKKYPITSVQRNDDARIDTKRVLRGGSWRVGKNRTTVAFRKYWDPQSCCDGHGFRPVIRSGLHELLERVK